jgi:hypothetical protein
MMERIIRIYRTLGEKIGGTAAVRLFLSSLTLSQIGFGEQKKRERIEGERCREKEGGGENVRCL